MESVFDKKSVVAKDVAIKEIQDFLKKHSTIRQAPEGWEIEKNYSEALFAVEKGLLVFDENMHPSYRLAEPIMSDQGTVMYDKIEFRIRVKPSDLGRISKGINIQEQQYEFMTRCVCYVAQINGVAVLDKLDRLDHKVIEQVATVFL